MQTLLFTFAERKEKRKGAVIAENIVEQEQLHIALVYKRDSWDKYEARSNS